MREDAPSPATAHVHLCISLCVSVTLFLTQFLELMNDFLSPSLHSLSRREDAAHDRTGVDLRMRHPDSEYTHTHAAL